jgi:hypothetical protein
VGIGNSCYLTDNILRNDEFNQKHLGKLAKYAAPAQLELQTQTIGIWKTTNHFLTSVKQVEASKQYKKYNKNNTTINKNSTIYI